MPSFTEYRKERLEECQKRLKRAEIYSTPLCARVLTVWNWSGASVPGSRVSSVRPWSLRRTPSITRLGEVLDFYRNQERRALEVLFTHRKLHGC
jgi:hypothetical protein